MNFPHRKALWHIRSEDRVNIAIYEITVKRYVALRVIATPSFVLFSFARISFSGINGVLAFTRVRKHRRLFALWIVELDNTLANGSLSVCIIVAVIITDGN